MEPLIGIYSKVITLGATALSIITLSIMTLSITTLSITTFSIIALIITMICHYPEWNYAECRNFYSFLLNVIMLNVVMLNVVAPSLRPYFINIRLGRKWLLASVIDAGQVAIGNLVLTVVNGITVNFVLLG